MVVAIKGAGEVFSGGADIREMVELDVDVAMGNIRYITGWRA